MFIHISPYLRGMNVLLVSATEVEVRGFLDIMERFEPVVPWQIEVCICGVGMVQAGVNLAYRLQQHKPDLILNAGIAGAIDTALLIGEVVWVKQDAFFGFGVDSPEGFQSAFNIGLAKPDEFPFRNGRLIASALPLPLQNQPIRSVDGITVQTVHGDEAGLARLKRMEPSASIESMEGAAIFYTATRFGIPAVQIRAISNYVEVRDKSRWNIPLAIRNLNQLLQAWFINP